MSALLVWLTLSTATVLAEAPQPPMVLSLHRTGVVATDPLDLPPDPVLTAALEQLIDDSELLSEVHARGELSLVLVDITDPKDLRTAMIHPDWETFTASLSKIAVLLGAVTKVDGDERQWRNVRHRANEMIKSSSNQAAISLFEWVGHEAIRDATYAHHLYHDTRGGIWWVPRSSFPQSPKTGQKICATAREVARYFLLMEQGRLNNPRDSEMIKRVLHNSKLALLHGGVVREEPATRYYGKPGVLDDAVSEGMLIEGDRVRYIVAVISVGTDYQDARWQDFGQALHKLILSRHPDTASEETQP